MLFSLSQTGRVTGWLVYQFIVFNYCMVFYLCFYLTIVWFLIYIFYLTTIWFLSVFLFNYYIVFYLYFYLTILRIAEEGWLEGNLHLLIGFLDS